MNTKIRTGTSLVLTGFALCILTPMLAMAEDRNAQQRACAIHAAVMVAEMKAGAASPLSDQELALVRQTAFKSCLAQAPYGASAAPAAAAQPAAAVAAAPVPGKRDTSFWGALKPILGGEATRSAGNERLFRRGRC